MAKWQPNGYAKINLETKIVYAAQQISSILWSLFIDIWPFSLFVRYFDREWSKKEEKNHLDDFSVRFGGKCKSIIRIVVIVDFKSLQPSSF